MTKRFEVWMERSAVVSRTWEVEAHTQEEAESMVMLAVEAEQEGFTVAGKQEDWTVLLLHEEEGDGIGVVPTREVKATGKPDLTVADVLSAYYESRA